MMLMMLASRLVKSNHLGVLVQQASGALGFGGQERSPDDAHDARLPPRQMLGGVCAQASGALGFGGQERKAGKEPR